MGSILYTYGRRPPAKIGGGPVGFVRSKDMDSRRRRSAKQPISQQGDWHQPLPWRLFCAGAVAAMLAVGASAFAGELDASMPIELQAQPLGEALRNLAKQADLQILFDASLVAGRSARPIDETLSPRAALERLLQKTGLEAYEQAPGVVVIRYRASRPATAPSTAR
jgi:hypothetical protein